jgi:hypothetical protein
MDLLADGIMFLNTFRENLLKCLNRSKGNQEYTLTDVTGFYLQFRHNGLNTTN